MHHLNVSAAIPEEVRSVQRLWRAVILNAFQEALSLSTQADADICKQRAIFWLLHEKSDFAEVCLSAGYSPRSIRQYARKRLETSEQSTIKQVKYAA